MKTHIRISLKLKLILVFTVISIGIIALYATTATVIIRSQLKNMYLESNAKVMQLGAEDIAFYISSIAEESAMPYKDDRVYQVLKKRGTFSYQDKILIDSLLMTTFFSYEDMKQIQFYVHNAGLEFIRKSDTSQLLKEPQAESVERPIPQGYQDTYPPQSYQHLSFNADPVKSDITFTRRLFSVPENEYLGDLSFAISKALLLSKLQSLAIFDSEIIGIIDKNQVVLSTQPLNPDLVFRLQTQYLSHNTAGDGTVHHQGEPFLVTYQKVPTYFFDTPLFLVKLVPADALIKTRHPLVTFNLIIGVLALALVTIGALFTAIRMTSPIFAIKRQLEIIEAGALEKRIQIRSKDEFGMLAYQINQMLDSIEQLIAGKYQLEIANKNNQIKALQAQISPHFLNNALQSIATGALIHEKPTTYDSIGKLASLMSYTMDLSHLLVPLRDEIRWAEHYLQIQSLRFLENLTYRISCPEKAKSREVPKMILQPVLENCFKHGMIDPKNPLYIEILVTHTPTDLSISVQDTGRGVTLKKLDTLLAQIADTIASEESSLDSSIGLSNIAKRLHLYYGEKASMTIAQNTPHGFFVSVTIPHTQDAIYDNDTHS